MTRTMQCSCFKSRENVYLFGILFVALIIRSIVIFRGFYIVHPDELYQYYEQAHRLAFGSGAVPWEFHDGARSWLVPALLAAIMKFTRLIGSDPAYYLYAIRFVGAGLSLTLVLVGFKLSVRRDGRFGAILTGLLCAVWIDPIFFAPSISGEVLSAYCILGCVLLADARERMSVRRSVLIGALLGLAVCLRIQVGPTALAVAVIYCHARWRECWLPLVAAGSAVVVLDLGLLDWLTWGAPFHSVWHYLLRGVVQDFGGGYADYPGETVFAYGFLIAGAWTSFALPLVVAVAIGAFRLPRLTIAMATLVETYLVFSNAEYRYICGALFAAPIFMGMGTTYLCNKGVKLFDSGTYAGRLLRPMLGTLIIVYASFVSNIAAARGILFRRTSTGVAQALLLAHNQPELCGLGVSGFPWGEGVGYTLLDREVPLFAANFDGMVRFQSNDTIKQTIELNGKSLPLFHEDELYQHISSFNYLISSSSHGITADYTPVDCFSRIGDQTGPKVCLFRRPGGCKTSGG